MKTPNVKRITIREYLENPTPERYERMIAQVYGASMEACRSSSPGYAMSSRECLDVAKAALRAIGITAPKKGSQ